MKFSTFAVGVWDINKMSLVAQKVGQIFGNSVKKNQLFISNGSGVINFLIKSCNPTFLRKKLYGSKTMTDKG
jgi:hypothetical protein